MKKLLLVLLVLLGLQTQAQIAPCDSVGYTIISGSGGNTTLQLNGIANIPGTVISWDWQVCTQAPFPFGSFCFSDTGQTAVFYQLNINDTIEVCLTTILDINNAWYTCVQCGYYVYGPNGWMKLGVLTSIKEVEASTIKDNKMYDLLGREIFEIPEGTIYIKNRKKYIR